jgi:hypothetical protein
LNTFKFKDCKALHINSTGSFYDQEAMILKKSYLKIAFSIPLLAIQACSSSLSSQDVARLALEVGSCDTFETLFHDKLQSSFQKTNELPDVDDVVTDFEEAIKGKLLETEVDEVKLREMKNNLRSLYSIIVSEAEKDPSLKDLVKLEYQTHENQDLQNKYNLSLNSYVENLKSQNDNCNPLAVEDIQPVEEEGETEEAREPLPFYEELKAKTNPAQYGAIKSFSVAYQSCTAHSQKPIDNSSERLEGVTRIGTHPAGGGIRVITDKNDVLRTHPYIVNNRVPASSRCADPEANPKIYDFGGKPYATSDENSTLNYFIDSGTGSKEFGVDCSGYIFTALMSAGLKLATNKPLRARGVYATPARAWKNLGSSMNCFAKVKAGETTDVIKPGDIFASQGHIFIINKVGEDPLGVKRTIDRGESCNSITHDDFDFTLFQSSPTNGAIGLNHMDGAYYLSGSSTMRLGFEKFARIHCNNLKNGTVQTPSISEASLIRHKMTPSCMEERVIELDYESCLERCSSEDA